MKKELLGKKYYEKNLELVNEVALSIISFSTYYEVDVETTMATAWESIVTQLDWYKEQGFIDSFLKHMQEKYPDGYTKQPKIINFKNIGNTDKEDN